MVQANCPSPISPRCVDGFQTDSRGRQACRIRGTVPKRSSANCGKQMSCSARGRQLSANDLRGGGLLRNIL